MKRSIFGQETGLFQSLVATCAAVTVTLCAVSCSKPPPEKKSTPVAPIASAPKPVVSAPPPPTASAVSTVPGDDLKVTWKTPEKWVATSAGGVMQKARYLTPPAAGDKEGATLTVFYFGPGMGGTVDANIERWVGQFKNVPPKSIKKSQRTVGNLTHHIVEIPEGVFEAGMMGGAPNAGPKYAWGMLGAVVEAPTGKYFFKLVGPKATIAASQPDFDALLVSIQEKP